MDPQNRRRHPRPWGVAWVTSDRIEFPTTKTETPLHGHLWGFGDELIFDGPGCNGAQRPCGRGMQRERGTASPLPSAGRSRAARDTRAQLATFCGRRNSHRISYLAAARSNGAELAPRAQLFREFDGRIFKRRFFALPDGRAARLPTATYKCASVGFRHASSRENGSLKAGFPASHFPPIIRRNHPASFAGAS